MEIKSLDELRRPDDRTLHYTSLGFDTGGSLRPEDAALYQQESLRRAELVEAVAEGTRMTFDRLCLLHSYGVLSYDMFTAADDLAQLVIEQALRDRFVEFHSGAATFQDAHGTLHSVPAGSFEEVYEEIHADDRLRRPQRWRLRVRATGELIYFDGMLDSLLRWARAEGLLRGQRNRHLEPVMKRIRNHVAHGAGHHLVTPVDSALSIRDAAEIINHLRGASTAGGRLYPAPIRRVVQIVAWNRAGSVAHGPAGPPADPQFADWTCVLVRAVLDDEGLGRLDALYDTTTFPCDVLWGPGNWEEASAWLERNQPSDDEVDVLDRLFLSQRHEGRLYLPRNPDIAATLDEDERHGIWYLTRADHPPDALAHTRAIAADGCSPEPGPCGKCAAESVGVGTWQEMLTLAANDGHAITPRRPPDVAVPSLRTWPRYFEVVDGAAEATASIFC